MRNLEKNIKSVDKVIKEHETQQEDTKIYKLPTIAEEVASLIPKAILAGWSRIWRPRR